MNDISFEEKVLKTLKDLTERVERIERMNQPFGPTVPNMPQVIPSIPNPIPAMSPNKCSKCGLVMDGPMGYCCPHRDCPCGMGPIWS